MALQCFEIGRHSIVEICFVGADLNERRSCRRIVLERLYVEGIIVSLCSFCPVSKSIERKESCREREGEEACAL